MLQSSTLLELVRHVWPIIRMSTKGRRSSRVKAQSLGQIECLESRALLTTFTVTTSADIVNAGDVQLSLREAVALANETPGADTIQFSAATNSGIEVNDGELIITDSLLIQGNGSTITRLDARGKSRVINFTGESGDLTLDGVSILNGRHDTAGSGGINFESTGSLTITNSILSGNHAAFYGGAIGSNFGAVTLINSLVTANTADIGGGLSSSRGAITLINSVVSGNSTNNGAGGIYSSVGTITLANSTVSGNSGSFGGGIYSGDGTITLTNSTVSGNEASGAGGGIFSRAAQISATNSTIAFNTANSVENGGGGILLFSLNSSLIARNAIIARNSAAPGAGLDIRQFNGGSVTLTNSLLGDNSGTSLTVSATPDANGNLIGGAGELAIDPLLGALGNYGGSTPNHALQPNSPAIDRGSNVSANGLTTDQRGLPRVSNGIVDMGSFEVQFPVANFDAATATVSESAGQVVVTVNLSEAFGLPVTIPFTIAGTASSPDDFTISASPLVIPAGQTSGTIVIQVVEASGFESPETIVLTLGNPTNGVTGNLNTKTLTIVDSSTPPTVSFGAAQASANENSGTYNITVVLSAASTVPVTIPYTVIGTAASPGDYTIPASPLVIPAGQTSAVIPVAIVDSASTEANETVIVSLGTLSNAIAGEITTTTLTIVDVAALPSAAFTVSQMTVDENDGQISLVVNLSSVSTLDTTIPFTVTGNASNPGDFTISDSPLVIPAGQTSGAIRLNLVDTVGFEPTEAIIVTLGAPTNATLGSATVTTITLLDLDAVPKVSLSEATSSVSEIAGTFSVTVNLSAPSSVPTTVPFSVTGTANNPNHYTIDASPLIIPAGQTSGSILLSLVDTTAIEPNQTVVLSLGTPVNGSLGTTTTSVITIFDSEVPTEVNFDPPTQSVSESVGTFEIVVKLTYPVGADVTVPYSLSGAALDQVDYRIAPSPLVIRAGESSATIQVTIVDDSLVESDESLIVTLGNPTNASLGATIVNTTTIRDNDFLPQVSFSAASVNVGEGSGTATLVVNLSAASTSNVTVPFSISGGIATITDDYSLSSSPLIIPAGQTVGTVTVNLVNDRLIEGNEAFIVTLGPPTNGILGTLTSSTITIVDDDVNTAPNIAAGQSFSLAENSPGATVVGQVSASDSDLPAPFNTLSFGLASNPGNRFAISPTGQITVVNGAVLDFEATPSLTLGVTVSDGGTPSLSTTQNVTINLSNVNEAPVLNDLTLAVAENSPNGSNVGTPLVATDPDAGQARTFQITGGNAGSVFAINPATGQLTVANSAAIDFETVTTFSLTVQVSDAGGLSDTATITINVANVNEPPRLQGGSGTVTYTKQQPPVRLFPGITVTTPEGETTLGTIVVSWLVPKKGSASDVNLGNTQSLGSVQFSGQSDFKKSAGTRIATITLNEGVTAEQVQNFLRQIEFSTKKFDPAKKSLGRKIDVQLFDRQEVATPSNILTTQIRAKKK